MTPAMELFVQRYMIRFNAERAYEDSHPNASWATCRTEGSKLLHDPRVASQIRALRGDARIRLANKRKANGVLDELSTMAFSNVADVFTGEGTIIPPHDMPREIAAAVKKVERTEILGALDEETGRRQILGHTVKLEMHDKVGPLKLLGQNLGIFTEPTPLVQLGKGFAAILEAANQRALEAVRRRLIEGEKIK
jgi:Terminase small subunit